MSPPSLLVQMTAAVMALVSMAFVLAKRISMLVPTALTSSTAEKNVASVLFIFRRLYALLLHHVSSATMGSTAMVRNALGSNAGVRHIVLLLQKRLQAVRPFLLALELLFSSRDSVPTIVLMPETVNQMALASVTKGSLESTADHVKVFLLPLKLRQSPVASLQRLFCVASLLLSLFPLEQRKLLILQRFKIKRMQSLSNRLFITTKALLEQIKSISRKILYNKPNTL